MSVSVPGGLWVPREYPTIQEAIDAAETSDTVIVADGVYTGEHNRDIDFKGKTITVRSENGPENCIINCQGNESEQHRAFYFCNGEDANSVLKGFTIMNGFTHAGAGIKCCGSSPTIRDCTISNNHADWGGGIYCDSSSPEIADCVINDNDADDGGGIYCNDHSSPTIRDCDISENDGGDGGGVKMRTFSCPTLINCILRGNFANDGGGIFCTEESSAVITKCTFMENQASRAGALWIGYCDADVSNCLFVGNDAEDSGAGMLLHTSSSTITHCLLVGNQADNSGGAMFNYNSSPMITNCILGDNQSPNGRQLLNRKDSLPTVSYCDIRGGLTSPSVVNELDSSVIDGGGNINANPMFVDAVGGDYHLLGGSPAIDAGDPTSDWSNEPWPNGFRVNMGAYGNTAEATRSPAGFSDLAVFGSFWLTDEPLVDIAPQPDGDGIANFLDFAVLADYWLGGI
jgi:hypothetical protein